MRYIILFFLIIFTSCNNSDNLVLIINSGKAQGTFFHIQYLSKNARDYSFEIDSIFLKIDSSLSIYKDYSLISSLNNGKMIEMDSLFKKVFYMSKDVYNETNGSFDCTIYPLVKEWGFYNFSFDDSLVIDSLKIDKLLDNIGFSKVNFKGDSLKLIDKMQLDFNAIAQGYTVDIIGGFLQKKGCTDFLIEVGGELLAKGRNADGEIWSIGVDKPTDTINYADRFQFILNLDDKAIATSGSYRKFFTINQTKYSHTISPFTGFPCSNRLLSVSVIHSSCALADAYATAFMVMGVKKIKEFIINKPEIEVYLVYTDKNNNWKTYVSPNLKNRIRN
ncbi:MAG: thiamine biosynthesis protein ApbE [Flavobacteriales bacterium]|nr:thiamine biosynthesis protein ApbE [Flavobacteriales bacterium]